MLQRKSGNAQEVNVSVMDEADLEVSNFALPELNCRTYIRVRGCRNDVVRMQNKIRRMVRKAQDDYCVVSTEQLAAEFEITLEDEKTWGILFYCKEQNEQEPTDNSFWFGIDSLEQPCYELMDKLARVGHVDFYYYSANGETEHYETNDWAETSAFGQYLVFEEGFLCMYTTLGGAQEYLSSIFSNDAQNYYEAVMEMESSDCYRIGEGEHYCHIYNLNYAGYGKIDGHDMEYSYIPRDPDYDAFETEWLVNGDRSAINELLREIQKGMKKSGTLGINTLAEWYGIEPEENVFSAYADGGRITFCEKDIVVRNNTFSFVVASPVVNTDFMERLAEKLGVSIVVVSSYEIESGKLFRETTGNQEMDAMIVRAFTHYKVKANFATPQYCSYLDAKYIVSRYADFSWDMIAGLRVGEEFAFCNDGEIYCFVKGHNVE